MGSSKPNRNGDLFSSIIKDITISVGLGNQEEKNKTVTDSEEKNGVYAIDSGVTYTSALKKIKAYDPDRKSLLEEIKEARDAIQGGYHIPKPLFFDEIMGAKNSDFIF